MRFDGGSSTEILKVLKVGHAAAASERIPVVMPQLVLVSTTFRPDELDAIQDRWRRRRRRDERLNDPT